MAKKTQAQLAEVNENEATELRQYQAAELLPDAVEFDELLENLAELNEVEFPRIRHKTGKFFFSDDPSDKGVEEFEGVIYYYGRQNTYWDGPFDAKNPTPPVCYSVDGIKGSKPADGQGHFGECSKCKWNEFKTAAQGKGKACRNQFKLYVQRLGTTVPMVLMIAPTSMKNFESSFLMSKVTQRGLNYARIVTRFKSYQAPNETHFQITFEVGGVFKGDEAATIKKLREYWLTPIKRDRSRLDVSDGSGNSSTQAEGGKSSSNTRTVEPRPAPAAPTATATVADDDEEPPF